MSRWRPIKSAPLDRVILLADPNHGGDCGWTVMQGRYIAVRHQNDASDEPPPFECWMGTYPAIYTSGTPDSERYTLKPIVLSPSHWMPLPQPPVRKPRS